MDLVFCNDFSKKFVRPNVHLVILSDSFVGQVPSAGQFWVLRAVCLDPETDCQVVAITITCDPETDSVRLLLLLLLRMASRQTVSGCYRYCYYVWLRGKLC